MATESSSVAFAAVAVPALAAAEVPLVADTVEAGVARISANPPNNAARALVTPVLLLVVAAVEVAAVLLDVPLVALVVTAPTSCRAVVTVLRLGTSVALLRVLPPLAAEVPLETADESCWVNVVSAFALLLVVREEALLLLRTVSISRDVAG
jgi:hypothetical protein